MTGVTKKKRSRKIKPLGVLLSASELAALGEGRIGYIRMLSYRQAREMFPTIEGLPEDTSLFALHGADGTPLALTDSHDAAVGHAIEDELEIASLH